MTDPNSCAICQFAVKISYLLLWFKYRPLYLVMLETLQWNFNLWNSFIMVKLHKAEWLVWTALIGYFIKQYLRLWHDHRHLLEIGFSQNTTNTFQNGQYINNCDQSYWTRRSRKCNQNSKLHKSSVNLGKIKGLYQLMCKDHGPQHRRACKCTGREIIYFW